MSILVYEQKVEKLIRDDMKFDGQGFEVALSGFSNFIYLYFVFLHDNLSHIFFIVFLFFFV